MTRRWLWLLLLVPVAIGLARLRFDVEVLNLLPDDLPAVEGLREYQENFADARDLIVTIRAPEADTASAAARSLAEFLRGESSLVRSVTWQPPWLENPAQSAEFLAYLWLNQPPSEVQALTNRLALTNLPATLAATRAALTTSMSPEEIGRRGYDPYGLMVLPGVQSQSAQFGEGDELFASAEGTFRLVFIAAREDLRTYQQCRAWLAVIRERVMKWQAEDETAKACTVRFTGHPAFLSEISTSMEKDMKSSVLGTAGLVAVLFWLAHRRLKPLLWLIALLGLVLVSTLGFGGLIFGTLNVVSLGFAAILLGLGVDYALVLYQESLASPEKPAAQIRRESGSSIFWGALTTAAAFLVLNWGGLPGLAQLGSLVTIGVIVAALVMSYLFLPPLLGKQPAAIHQTERAPIVEPIAENKSRGIYASATVSWVITGIVTAVCLAILARGAPRLDASADPLRPLNSDAYFAMEELQQRLGRKEPLYVLVEGNSEVAVANQLREIQGALERAQADGKVKEFTLPVTLWPHPENQASNRNALATIASQREALRSAASTNGFSADSLRVTESMLDAWQHAAAQGSVYWPSNFASRWILDKVTAHKAGKWLALGVIDPATPHDAAWAATLQRPGVWITGWGTLGESVFGVVKRDLWYVLIPMAVLITIALWCAFRSWQEVGLSLLSLALSYLVLLVVMRLAGWEWNLMNLMALPLLLGMAEDYSIHMQHALHRHHGDVATVQKITGRALFLCAATTIAGFGSLAWSSNAGLASLGKVCATGITCAYVISLYLLPGWWRALIHLEAVRRPSSFYRKDFWRFGMALTRALPESLVNAAARTFGLAYWLIGKSRREVVIRNLLPVVQSPERARKTSRSLYQQFGQKLVDLWRFESGVTPRFGKLEGWENFLAASANGRGVLFVTPHLGNWEFGGPIMTERKVKLYVITLTEPDAALTELRQASRSRWGIETVVIGQNAFAFVEIIKLLQGGATIALLMDRPVAASAVTVELFGQPFPASIAAAELARASGCAVVPTTLLWNGERYDAELKPEVHYDRAALGSREARIDFTGRIMKVFEPAIRNHPDQWYHFVPVWPEK